MAAENDSDDLQALFDSIVSAHQEEEGGKPAAEKKVAEAAPASDDPVFNKIGHMTRALHDTLRELGVDKKLQEATAAIPDARDRLNYIANMTQQAAERVLNATDAAQPVVEKIGKGAEALANEWQQLFDGKLSPEQFKQLAERTHAYLRETPAQAKAANAQLTEIMMAQDFQDLTGQVIKKITELTQKMEAQLVELLVETAPAEIKKETGLLNGPVVNAAGRSDVVTSQQQVDELLESLGF